MPSTVAVPDVSDAGKAFERLGRLCRQAPHLKPMAFEALLQMRLGLLAKSVVADRHEPCAYHVEPIKVAGPKVGTAEPSHLAFTRASHGAWIVSESGFGLCSGMDTFELLDGLLPTCRHLIIDAGTSHQLDFMAYELRNWLVGWALAPDVQDPFENGSCHFHEVSDHPQVLLDRLDAILASVDGVERCFLMRFHPNDSRESTRLALIVQSEDADALERIRRAMPLIRLGLGSDDAPRHLMHLNRHPGFAEGLQRGCVTPIYDRATAASWR